MTGKQFLVAAHRGRWTVTDIRLKLAAFTDQQLRDELLRRREETFSKGELSSVWISPFVPDIKRLHAQGMTTYQIAEWMITNHQNPRGLSAFSVRNTLGATLRRLGLQSNRPLVKEARSRQESALAMHQAGASFKQIAAGFGVSQSRAAQLVKAAQLRTA